MVQRIRNFWAMIATVADILRNLFIDPVRARAELFLEDLDQWLADHNLTIPQIAGNFLGVAFGLMALGVGIDLAGLVVGQWLSVPAARGIITAGTLISLAGLLPLLVLLNLAHGLYDLVLRGGVAAMEILSNEHNDIPARIRTQLEAMRNRRNLTGTMRSFYAAFTALTVSFMCWANLYGFYGIVVGAVAVSGIVTLRNINCVRGFGIIKAMLAGCYGLAGGNIVFLVFYAIGRPLLFWGWPGVVSDQNALRFSLITGTIAALATFLYQAANLRLKGEEDAIRRGELPIEKARLKPRAIDPETGRVTQFDLVHIKPFDWGELLKSRLLWGGFVAVALVVYLLFKGNPLSGIGPLKLVAYAMFAGLILILIGIFSGGNAPQQTAQVTSAQEARHDN